MHALARWYIVDKIGKARQVYSFQRIILINHSDCGIYLALDSFLKIDNKERYHEEQLVVAKAFLQKKFPDVNIEIHYFSKRKQEFIY